jgi:hypothetical protein
MQGTHNPFSATSAGPVVVQPADEGNLLGYPRLVFVGDSIGWLRTGWELFKRAPATWIAIVVVFAAITVALSFVPILGILTALLVPVFTGGIMLGCHELKSGGKLVVSDVFGGFRRQVTNLLMVGAIALVASIVIMIVVGIGAASLLGAALLLVPGGDGPPLSPGAIAALAFLAVVCAALMAPVAMAVWFAPAMVAIDGEPPIDAMKKASLAACETGRPCWRTGASS